MRARDLDALEFPRVLDELARFARSPAGQRACRQLRPTADLARARSALRTTAELAALTAEHGEVPLGEFPDLRATLVAVARPGFVLDGPSLLSIRHVLDAAEEVRRFLRQHTRPYPTLKAWLDRIAPLTEVRSTLHRALDDTGAVTDDASEELARVRAEVRHLRARLERRLEALLHEPRMQECLADHFVTLRHNRYVIPIRSSHASRFDGVVQDRSASGETTFIEPLFAVEANNRLIVAAKEEERLVQRILADLTEMVRGDYAALEATFQTLVELDRLAALVRYGRSYGGTVVELGAGEVDLRAARHPLLLAQAQEAIPIDLCVPPGKNLLVITGPNTGGKTVALKTLGLLALMAQAGFLLPVVEGSRLPHFEAVFADIGDEQSLARNLSTFSAHVANLVEILGDRTTPRLVLLDEPGVGTDPEEGAALAIGLLRSLSGDGTVLAVTTHYAPVKVFALAEANCVAAAVDFDVAALEPKYRLVYHSVGESLALPIAARLGLPAPVLAKAAEARSQQGRALAEAMAKLEAVRRSYEEKLAEAERARQRAEAAERDAAQLVVELREKQRQRWSTELQHARQFLLDLRTRGEELLARLERKEADRRVLRRFIDEGQQTIAAAAQQWEEPGIPARDPQVGDWVEVVGQGVRGRLAKVSGERAWIERGSLRFEVPFNRLRRLAAAGPEPMATQRVQAAPPVDMEAYEISLLGLRARDAVERLDQCLDRAVRDGVARVRVIHGIGSGALKRAVSEYLSQSPYCASFHQADPAEGGAGVTVVELGNPAMRR